MKKLKYFTFLIIPILLISCSSELQENIVQVVAKDFRFEVADQIPSGWSTFEFDNQGHAEHFFLLQKLPDTVSYDTYVNNVTKSFDTVFDSIKAGSTKAEAVDLLLKLVPSWYFTSVKQMGGTGIVSSNKNTRVTLKLEPGIYAMECYIKEQGIFHTALGMISRLEVTTDRSQNIPPEADVELTLSNFKIDSKGELESGANIIAVNFKEHPEQGMGNDLHIVKILPNSNIDSIIYWMDWMNVKGLESPAPAEFYGGIQEMPAGSTGYCTVLLTPGKYALLGESTASRGVLKTVTIE